MPDYIVSVTFSALYGAVLYLCAWLAFGFTFRPQGCVGTAVAAVVLLHYVFLTGRTLRGD